MVGRHKKLSNSVVIFALFFSAFTLAFGNIYVGFSEGAPTSILGVEKEKEEKAISVSSEVKNISKNNEGTYTVDYEIVLTNISDKNVSDISLTNNFQNTFPNNNFSINSISSNFLNINETYDGIDVTELLAQPQNLTANASNKITLSVNFDPGSSVGPFENVVNSSGLLDGVYVKSGDTDSDSKDGDAKDKVDNNLDKKPDEKKDKEIEEIPDEPKEVEENLEKRIIRLYLVDTLTGADLVEIVEGSKISVTDLTSNPISIRAAVEPNSKGSVVFGFDSNSYYKIENNAPFAISGNSGNLFSPWKVSEGLHNLSVSAFTGKGGNGLVIGETSVNFEFIGEIPYPAEEVVEEQVKEDESQSFVATSSQTTSLFSLDEIVEGIDQFIPKQDLEPKPIESAPIQTADDVDQVVEKSVESVEQSSPKVLSIAIAKDASSGRVLAATGINVSQVVLIGMFIMIAVIELNMVRSEKKLFTKFTHAKTSSKD